MKKKITNLFGLSGLALSCTMALSSFAQDATVDGIKVFEAAGSITGKGIFAVYQADGEKGKLRNYTIKQYDFNYKETSSDNIEMSKVTDVLDATANDGFLGIAFIDRKEASLKVRSFDETGAAFGKMDIPTSKYGSANIYPTSNGFIVVNQITKGVKSQFEIYGVRNNLKQSWKIDLPNPLTREVIDVVSSPDGIAIVYTEGKGMKKENYNQHLLRLTTDGKEVFNEIFASNYYYFPNKILLDGTDTYVFGSFPENGKSRPVGVFAVGYNKTGKQLLKNEINYQKEIGDQIKDLNDEEDIKMKEKTQFIVNDAIKTEDGFYVITETIGVRPSIGGTVEVSSGGSGGSTSINTTFVMGNFLVLKLNETCNLANIKVVKKKKNTIAVQGAVINVNQYYKQLKNGMSNYQFYIMNEAGHPNMVYTERKSFRSNVQIGVVDLSTEDRVNETVPAESEMGKLKDFNNFGVMHNVDNKVSVMIFKRGVMSFYDFTY